MSIEALLSELTAAIRENTAAVKERNAAPAAAAETPAPKRTRSKGSVEVTPPVEETPAAEPEVEPASEPEVEPAAGEPEVDYAALRANVKTALLAYRDAVRDGSPASVDPGEAVKAATAAARDILKPFKAAKFDEVKDDDLAAVGKAIKTAHDALSAADDLDLDV